VGPNTCCWHYYWNSAAGEADKALNQGADFLPWFLEQVRQHDERTGMRTLDVLDVHYHPEDYPDTRLGLSEWTWGADMTMNGALAVADVLGILGREQVYYAAYRAGPPPYSPAYYSFKMYTNFDDHGSQFGDLSVWSQSDDIDVIASHAALDSATGSLHLMLINKQPEAAQTVSIDLRAFTPGSQVEQYRLVEATPPGIGYATIDWVGPLHLVDLPAYSITLLVFEPA
jgi:hypothetical protein